MVLDLFAEVTALAAGVLLWLPAYRFSRDLLAVHHLNQVKRGDPAGGALSNLAQKIREAILRGQQKWDRLDHWSLMLGFALVIFSALLKIAAILTRN